MGYLNGMNRHELGLPKAGEAKLHYLDADYQVVVQGDYVRCAVTGQAIRLEDLRYWSVERQEPYVNATAALKRYMEARSKAG